MTVKTTVFFLLLAATQWPHRDHARFLLAISPGLSILPPVLFFSCSGYTRLRIPELGGRRPLK